MANIMVFKEGDVLIGQGDEDTVAYLIQSGWVEVRRRQQDGRIHTFTLQAGEIVGELGLAGLSYQRTATVTALTDGEVEVIDRGALIRLVNGPASRLTPLLAALFSRLKLALDEDASDHLEDTFISYAKLEGTNKKAQQALCNRPRMVYHLPWVFGAHRPPQSVTDLFAKKSLAHVKLAGCSRLIREEHLYIENAPTGGLQLRVAEHGDFCLLDNERVGYGKNTTSMPLCKGLHTLKFGEQVDPFEFNLDVLY
ncbi:MAG: cyclic nucleotide-binding domain-containing protein [Mariprofundaceae bacterium]|nr:cyclic nucleotide-binding domain-containing protein [Mariprofundaceae bacterium]